MAVESRTVEEDEVGRVEVVRSAASGITAHVVVALTTVMSRVAFDGRVEIAVARDGKTIWRYELGVTEIDENAVLRAQAEAPLTAGEAPIVRRRGRPPLNRPAPERKGTTLADLAARQHRE